MPRFHPLRILALLTGALVMLLPLAPAKPADWAKDIAAFTAADALHPPPAGAVLFLGSSSIRMWETLAEDFPGVTLIQRGFGGSELADSLFYADRIALPYHPRLIVLYAGENDIASGKAAEAVAGNFSSFVAKIHAAQPETRILYVSIKPSPSRAKFQDEFTRANALIAAACARDPRLGFVNIVPALLDAKGGYRPELYRADLLHLNHDGYRLWAQVLAPLLKP